MGNGGRLRAGLRFSGSMIALSRAALRARNPGLDERALRLLWIEENYGAALARDVERHQEAVGWTRADELTKGLSRMAPTSGMYTRPARRGAATGIR